MLLTEKKILFFKFMFKLRLFYAYSCQYLRQKDSQTYQKHSRDDIKQYKNKSN
jgi:hypothetical protein